MTRLWDAHDFSKGCAQLAFGMRMTFLWDGRVLLVERACFVCVR